MEQRPSHRREQRYTHKSNTNRGFDLKSGHDLNFTITLDTETDATLDVLSTISQRSSVDTFELP